MAGKMVEMSEMCEILQECFFVLRTRPNVSEDPAAMAAVKLIENCCVDLIRSIYAMGETLGHIDGERDNEDEPFILRKKGHNDFKQKN